MVNRRIAALWLPTLPIERLSGCSSGRLAEPSSGRLSGRLAGGHPGSGPLAFPDIPSAVVEGRQGRAVLVAIGAAAARAGLVPGMSLADARALEPGLRAIATDPSADQAALAALADWAGRYTPWVAACGAPTMGEGGLLLDITGCAHLFGGEAGLVRDLVSRLGGLGYAARVAVADSVGAAWAVARVGPGYGSCYGQAGRALGDALIRPGAAAAALAALPIAGLRLDDAAVAGLERLGLRRIGDLYRLPRGPLAARFGTRVLRRLDQALGAAGEPVSPLRPVAPFTARLILAEAILRGPDVAAGLDRLLASLCRDLEWARRGARRVELALYRVDGAVVRQAVGTHRPSRRADHIARLFAERLERIDPGFGIEAMVLSAVAVDPLEAEQIALPYAGPHAGADADVRADTGSGVAEDTALADLIDRLGNRLGGAAVRRPVPQDSYLPERTVGWIPSWGVSPGPGAASANAVTAAAVSPAAAWPRERPRPVRLFGVPQRVEAVAPVPDDPPRLFRWRGTVHRIARADGPERIAAEWWRDPPGTPVRDYYRVEDVAGRRFWLFRAGRHDPGRPARWYLHGLFA